MNCTWKIDEMSNEMSVVKSIWLEMVWKWNRCDDGDRKCLKYLNLRVFLHSFMNMISIYGLSKVLSFVVIVALNLLTFYFHRF